MRRRGGAAEHAVDDSAHGAVATMYDYQVHSVGNGCLAEFSPVTTVFGVLDSEFDTALERVCDQVACGRCDGGGGGVHDQHGTHEP